jgi:bifunctional pyridoxal-dependent enzyme with beta-cystathionase and maltose regulon repressor activities
VAFGPEGEGSLRWCFAAQRHLIDDGVARLARLLGSAAGRVESGGGARI